MSDPAKSADEIEDVLASIRRLVSESGAAAPRSEAAAAPAKLVLTPAQRVSDPDDPWAPVPSASGSAEGATDEAPAKADDDDDPAWGLEDRLSDWGEIEESADEAIADAMAEEGLERPARFEMPTEADDVSESEDAFDMSGLAQLDGVIDGDEAGDVFEPETGDMNWPDGGADSALRDLAAARFGQSATTVHPPPDPSAEVDATRQPAEPLAEDTEADAEVIETTANADTTPQPEPVMTEIQTDDLGEEDRAEPGFAPIFSRRMEAAGTDAGADEDIEALGETPSPFTFPDTDEGILDEETLREIVAEVVREELQGALGQRITRNVRKMVRREIRIALAAEDLE
jgi:hypothetical protein